MNRTLPRNRITLIIRSTAALTQHAQYPMQDTVGMMDLCLRLAFAYLTSQKWTPSKAIEPPGWYYYLCKGLRIII